MKVAKYTGSVCEYKHELLDRPLQPGERVAILGDDEDEIADALEASGLFDVLESRETVILAIDIEHPIPTELAAAMTVPNEEDPNLN
jgi:hypothetical protein